MERSGFLFLSRRDTVDLRLTEGSLRLVASERLAFIDGTIAY